MTPSRASTETVKGVSNGDSFLAAIRSSPSSSQRSGVSERQISPRASFAMKLIASGVANCAAIVRSPSFSRSSSSQTTTILPSRMSSIACSIVAKRAPVRVLMRVRAGGLRYPIRRATCLASMSDLDVHPRPRLEASERRALERLGDQRDGEAVLAQRADGQADAVHRDRPLLYEVARELWLDVDLQDARDAVDRRRGDRAGAVDVALDDVPAQPVAEPHRELEVDRLAAAEVRRARSARASPASPPRGTRRHRPRRPSGRRR